MSWRPWCLAWHTAYAEPHRLLEFGRIYHEIASRNPNHVLLNQVVDGCPVPISRSEINAAGARAAVGLVLSSVEGASYASMEYMLAGLAVVSTPSAGGRDVYFDPDYCLICEPTAEAVAAAVAELKGRNIPRGEIRARTLAKIAPARDRFLELIDEVLIELGAKPRFAGQAWPFQHWSGIG